MLKVIIFCVLALLQFSFLAHFAIYSQTPNLILIFLFSTLFFSPTLPKNGLEILLPGFFLDVFSNNFFGVSIPLLYLDILFMGRAFVYLKRQNIFHFIILFLPFLLFYDIGIEIFSCFAQKTLFSLFNKYFLIHIIYNLVIASLGFCFYICLVPKFQKIFGGRKSSLGLKKK